MTGLLLPPLFHGVATVEQPSAVAERMARAGCDAGTLVYNLSGAELQAAIIFAPEVPLAQAMAMLPVCGIGFQNALGALAPPEVAVNLKWDGRLMVNGASCGALTAAASTNTPDALPDWLIISLSLPLWSANAVPGDTPDVTALYDEGCSDIAPADLVAAWARHTLIWVNQWSADGARAIHSAFAGLWHKDGADLGLDPDLGLLRKSNGATTLTPLTTLLEPA
ncbi:biotin/lipoate--protein ligase family protein [Yoonia sp. I 8.24]|uniref:biotin/lipoate--protein ligase family protein n=1 Tax=Yoonia sp. I 8.24 TaxID=1537229 RepID=UPI001EE0CF6C|nr:biotin/lipoate--protein ligase family protein [Yoonia sp. I 8.24]MCG3266565.1 biotin/lipoate--protein ligase family protein [Yoonia sp. I 8.24]